MFGLSKKDFEQTLAKYPASIKEAIDKVLQKEGEEPESPPAMMSRMGTQEKLFFDNWKER